MSQTRFDYTFNIYLVGNDGIGKTGPLSRMCSDRFGDSDFRSNAAIDFLTRDLQLDEKCIRIRVSDVCPGGRFAHRDRHCQRADGVVLAYDITDRASFEEIPQWSGDLDACAPDACRLLVGTKADLEDKRVIASDKGEELAAELGMPFMETSSKQGCHVDEVFMILIIALTKRAEPAPPEAAAPNAVRVKHNQEQVTARTCWQ
jgi:GTPase SAR1 family protein